MSLVINSNQRSLNSLNQLRTNSSKISQQLEKISSGLRINSAKDDAAGLSISTRMQAQKQGLGKAIANAEGAMSLSQTAQGSFTEITNMLQRMRELVVQAGNETLNDEDRFALQSEIEMLKLEIDHIGDSEFNSKRLFGNEFNFHLGADNVEGTNVSLRTQLLSSDRLGHRVVVRSQEMVDTTTSLDTGQLRLIDDDGNEVLVRATSESDDLLSTANRSGSALAKAAAINSGTELHGVTAIVNESVFRSEEVVGTTLDQDNYIEINGEKITGFTVEQFDADETLKTAINAVSDRTGVVATADQAGHLVLTAEDGRNIAITVVGTALDTGLRNEVIGGSLELVSEDTFTAGFAVNAVNNALGVLADTVGPNAITNVAMADGSRALTANAGQSGVSNTLNADFTLDGVGVGSVVNIDADESNNLNLRSTGDILTFQGNNRPRSIEFNQVITANSTTTVSLNLLGGIDTPVGNTTVITGDGNNLEESDGSNEDIFLQISVDNGANWQIAGRFTNDTLTLPASDPGGGLNEQERLEAARITKVVTLNQDYKVRVAQLNHNGDSFDHFAIVFGEVEISEPNFIEEIVFGENYKDSVASIDVTSIKTVDAALRTIDEAIEEVNEMQVKLGALQNRLDSTIRNLSQSKENISYAQSRITDADFAIETAELSRSQIIQQAITSILAQANQESLIVLQLLE